MMVSNICGVLPLRASCRRLVALHRAVPQVDVPAALLPNVADTTVQVASASLWRIDAVPSITSPMNASITSSGSHGAPRRAVMSDGSRSVGCTRDSASTLRA